MAIKRGDDDSERLDAGARRNNALAPQRHARILDEVQRAGGVRVSDLTRLLGVSDMTVRRDLEVLARRGLIAKVHGGATAVGASRSADEPGFEVKRVRESAEKDAIAAAAAGLVEPGSAIAITAGTTTWALARHLLDVPQLTVVTNSVPVAEVFHQGGRTDQAILTGGVRTPSDALVGPVAVSTIRSLRVDVVLMGVHGFDPAAGLTTPNLMEAETNRAFIAAARRLVVVADHTKWGTVGLSQIAPLDAADVVVTDSLLDADALAQLREIAGEVVVADVATGRAAPVRA